MQEPILFNQSIKDNILYGMPTASDSDIRRACEQANALQFIESNFEELNKEQRTILNLESLQSTIKKLKDNYPNFVSLKDFELKEDYVEVLLAVLSKSDQKALETINNHIESFIKFFTEVGNVKGFKWDDIVVKHEWNCEISNILKDLSERTISADEIETVKSYAETKKYQFDSKTVNEWLSYSNESFKDIIDVDSTRIRQV